MGTSVLRDLSSDDVVDACKSCSLTNGASVRMTGTIVASPGAGQAHELQVDSLKILGECNPDVSLRSALDSLVCSRSSLGIPDPETSPYVRVPPRPCPLAPPDRRERGHASSSKLACQISPCLLRGTFHIRAKTFCSHHPTAHQKLHRERTFVTYTPPSSLPATVKAQVRPSV